MLKPSFNNIIENFIIQNSTIDRNDIFFIKQRDLQPTLLEK
jgi:hypothetical protein